MPVFKLYLKLCLEKWKLLLIYFVIGCAQFISISMNMGPMQQDQSYTQMIHIGVMNMDTSQSSASLISYLQKQYHVDMIETKEELEAALFYRAVAITLEIPENFKATFDSLGITYDTYNLDAMIVKQSIEEYLHTLHSYQILYPNASSSQIEEMIQPILSLTTDTKYVVEDNRKEYQNLANMMKFSAYTSFSTLFACIGYAMYTLQEKAPFQRILCSPIRISSIILQSYLATGAITIIVYVLYMVGISSFYMPYICSKDGLVMLWICFLLHITLGSIVFMISCLLSLKKDISIDVYTILGNLLPLVCSFIGGVFVQQKYMPDYILKLASFTPTYWFVQALDAVTTGTYTIQVIISSIVFSMFTIVCLLGAMVCLKRYVNQQIV